jgi:energy-coupling factor transporter ATP-binding protein EcfA2
MIELKNVTFQYNGSQKQLSDLSLDIKKGELVVVTGPSGCGKTTLTRVINGLIPHFYEGKLTGEVYLNGQNAVELQSWEFGKLVGSVFQDPKSQFFAIAVQDEIAFSCENYGVPSKEIASRLTKAAGALRIEHLLLRQLTGLSSGEKQKVAVASVATIQPAIYVMDEPSANLDMKATAELALILKKLKENGATIVVAEHRLYYLVELADRIIYMKDGRLQREFTLQQMKALTKHQLSEMGLRATELEWRKCSNPTAIVASSQNPIVSVQDLCLRVGKRRDYLLANLSFDLLPGEIVALTGSNGVGKTTLARMLCGLAREVKGQILFDGDAVKPSVRYKHAWFVMQDTDCQLFSESVLGEMTVGRKTTPELQRKAEEILTELGLWEFRDRHPASLSGGQKQRLTLAVAFMQDTPLLVLDEPTSGLDRANLEKLVQCIKKQAEQGRAVLIITHDHELVQSACSRMLHLAKCTLAKDFSLHSENYALALDCMLTEERF